MGLDEERLIAMKAGGQNLDELTKFCKELAKKVIFLMSCNANLIMLNSIVFN